MIVTTDLAFGERPSALGDVEMTTALLDRPARHGEIAPKGNESWRFENRARSRRRSGGTSARRSAGGGR